MNKLFTVFTFVFALSFIAGLNVSAQDAPISIGPAPYVYNNVEQSIVFDNPLPTSRGFSVNATSISSSQVFKYFLGTPGTSQNVGTASANFLGSGDFGGSSNLLYMISQISPYVLYSVDTTTGARTTLGTITGINAGHSAGGITGCAWDATTNTMYLTSTAITSSALYTLNLSTQVATQVGGLITNAPGIIALGCSNTGLLYAIDIVNDNLWSINKTTGAATLVGALGYNANYGQDCDFDPADDVLYWAAIGTGVTQLRTINTTTGMSTLVGNFTGQNQVLATGIPGAGTSPVFCEDFESFTVGQRLACQDSINWTTWSHDPCNTTEDPLISSAQSFSPTKSVVIAYNNDLVKELGNDTTGIHSMTFKFYVPTTKTGYWNTLAGFLPSFPNKWGMECYFDVAATGNNGRLFAGSSTAFPFAYTHGSWQTAMLVVNLDIDSAKFYMNENLIRTWRWTAGANGSAVPKRLAGNNFYGALASNEMYVDNYCYDPDANWILTGVTQNGNTVPTEYALSQNYPNPFNPSTKINFAIPTTGLVTMKIYDVLGKEVATLINEVKNPGNYIVEFDGGNLSSGVYFYKIQVGDFSSIKRMVLLK